MALHWLWKNKCGEAIIRRTIEDKSEEWTVSLYQGNAFLIFINQFKDEETGKDMYSLYTFFADEVHAKRCLGLDKDYSTDNMFLSGWDRLVKIRIDKSKHTKYKKLLDMFIKAFDELEIELYKEEGDKDET